MRKLKLLLTTLTLLVGGALSASAETDATNYITNPNFSTSSDGWTITGDARLFNGTGFDGDKFIELTNWGSSWDATISQNVTVPNGYYKVKAAGQMSGTSDCWMKLVANGAENYFSRNGDTNGNILEDGTETTIGGDGYKAGWRYSSVIAKVTDGTLAISCVGHSDVKERWANFDHVTLTYLGESIPAGTNVSDFINNWDFWGCYNGAFNGWTISAPNGGNTWKNGESNVEFWIGSAANGAFDYYQELAGLPAGNYIVSASMWNSTNGEDPAPTGVNEQCGVYATSSSTTVFKGVNVDGGDLNTYTTDGIIITDGALRIGVKNNETMGARWFGVDWINLIYQEPCISAIATEIPAATATALTADKWYKFTAASTDNFTFATTTIGNIVTTTTDQLLSTATGDVATATMALTSGTTYYIMSTTAQTLTISPQSFTYTVGDAKADKSYIQKGNTVTVSYASLGTDDPGASLTKDFSGVTFGGNAISVTPTDNGFTFEVPEVTAAKDYVLAIPVGAIKYNDENKNAAQEITLKTPAVFDGTYYLYDATNKLFLSRGKNNGSRAVVDLYGIPFNLVTDGNGASLISFLDWNDKYLFFDKDNHADCWIYTDGGASNANRFFAFEAATGGYYLRDAAKAVYIKHDNSVLNVPTTTENQAAVWTVMTKADRDAIVNAYPTTNKSNVITAASISTTAAEFETFLAANYAAKDQTSKVGTAKFAGDAGDWTWTKVVGAPAYGTDWTEGFQTAGTWSQTISDLTPGIYKVTVNGFERKAGYALCNTLAAEGYQPVTAYFKANEEQLPLKSWYSDKEGINNPDNTSQAATAFNNDKYKNTIYTYVADAGEGTGSLTITIGKQDKASGSWVLFNNVTLTYYDSSVSSEEIAAIIAEAGTEMAKPMKPSLYQALKSANSAFEASNTVPNYNALRTAIDNTATSVASYAAMNKNYLEPIDAILTSSNIIDQSTSVYDDFKAYSKKYDNYKDALTEDIENATANALTIYQGTGARYTGIGNILMATGWKIDGTDALTDGSGFYVNTWSTENAGTAPAADFANPFYEMWVSSGSIAASTLTRTIDNLTPNGTYKLTANVRIQGDDKVAGSITMDLNGGPAVDLTAGSKIGETARYIGAYTAYGQADGTGKLTITITVAADSKVSWFSFRDLNYEEATNVDVVTITAAGYATYASDNDLDFTGIDGLEAYSAKVSGSNVVLTQVTTVPHGSGIVLKGAAGTYYVPNTTGIASWDGPVNDLVRGENVAVATNDGTYNNYVLSTKDGANVGFYQANNEVVPTNRAYLRTTASSTSRLNIIFDGETTSINAVEKTTENGSVYNLQGQRVTKAQKGLYIQNGRKVLVK